MHRCYGIALAFFLIHSTVEAAPVDYVHQVKPLFEAKCFGCHGAVRQQSGLRLDAASLIREGGDRGPAIVPGDSEASLLIRAVVGDGDVERMPPEDEGTELSDAEVALLATWIDEGANAPDEPVPPRPDEHWAFQSPSSSVALPSVLETHPIDTFLSVARTKHDLVAVERTDPATLLRRVYLDLIGVPPTPRAIRSFVQNPTHEAYERVVDRLLADPRYGERWGRHWMDIWRYTDWSGLDNKMRHSQKHIWRWRDWIIESLNADKGYDQMIQEMIAGDELEPLDPQTVRATGFLARNWYLYNRNFWLDDIVEHTSKGFLGITLNCARCHEHKYDPISQADYYRFRAFFEPHQVRLDQVGSEVDLEKDGLPRVFDADLDAKTYVFVRGEESRPLKDAPQIAAIPTFLSGPRPVVEPVSLPVEAYFPALREETRASAKLAAQKAVDAATEDLNRLTLNREENQTVESETPDLEVTAAIAMAQHTLRLREAEQVALDARQAADIAEYLTTKLTPDEKQRRENRAAKLEGVTQKRRGELDVLVAEQKVASLSAQDSEATPEEFMAASEELESQRAKLKSIQNQPLTTHTRVGEVYPTQSTGRRLALARWITDERNPLTARVAVNHIWFRHFGAPLVDSMFDFGLRAQPPIHQSMLDWLAIQFMDQSWSMKRLHRLIVTSEVYQLRSADSPTTVANNQIDPDNHFLWRMNTKRMEAEVVRDSLLFVSGQIEGRMGGPDLAIPAVDSDALRRSIYYRYSRDHQIRFLTMFDTANVEECYRRRHSIVPQQALAMSNSELVLTRAAQLAARITREIGDSTSHDRFLREAFAWTLGRNPSDKEVAECVHAASQLSDAYREHNVPSNEIIRKIRTSLVHVLLNHNDFVTIR